jgi:hypothetical protein
MDVCRGTREKKETTGKITESFIRQGNAFISTLKARLNKQILSLGCEISREFAALTAKFACLTVIFAPILKYLHGEEFVCV